MWRRFQPILESIATVSMIAVSVALIWVIVSPRNAKGPDAWRPPREKPVPLNPVDISDAWTRGDQSAKVGILEFSDFECPYCMRYHREAYQQILQKYVNSGRVLLIFRHLPLPRHALARQASVAAECAGKVGRFWEMHDSLFEPPPELGLAHLISKARDLGLDPSEFESCMKASDPSRLDRDVSEAKALGVTGTPTFFLGQIGSDLRLSVRKRESGAMPAEVMSRMLDDLLRNDAGQ
jgi:protein-disulfide isomerase